jgi:hypothetical protein
MMGTGYLKLAELYMRVATEAVIAAAYHLRGLRFEPPRTGKTIGRAGHGGAPAHSVDVDMDEALRGVIYEFNKEIVFMGEESAAGANLRPQRIFAYCDPVDGTTNLRALDLGWAIVVFFERVRSDGERFAHLGGAIYTSSGTIVSWARGGVAGVTRIHHPAAPVYDFSVGIAVPNAEDVGTRAAGPRTLILKRGADDAPSKLLRGGSSKLIAAVAASGERRRLLDELYDFTGTGFNVWTIGGNPMIAPLLVGDLGAVIEVERVDLHDAVYLMPLVIAGGHVFDHDGREINVFSAFENAPRTTVEPFVAVVSPAVADDIRRLRRLRPAA